MTFVGKILVIVIMVFSLFFLALSTVVFTTSMNWKGQVTVLNDTKKKLEDEKRRLTAEVGTQAANLQQAKDTYTKEEKKLKDQVKDLNEQNVRRQTEITGQRTTTEMALQEVKKAQDEAEARISESNVLRQNLQTVQNQRDDFRLQKTELDQKITILKRENEVAGENNKNLREKVALYGDSLRKLGQPTDIATIKGVTAPKDDVEGEVTRVGTDGKTLEISIGKDDGLVEGNELVLFRTKPAPAYLGKVKIISVDPDQAVAKVIGTTYHGIKPQEGDNVATKVRPRS